MKSKWKFSVIDDDCIKKNDVINIIKRKVKETSSGGLKWQYNQIIREINELPDFFLIDSVVSSTTKDNNSSKSSNIELPDYYGESMDLLTACEKGLVEKEKLANFCELNIIKYVLRYKQKGGINDLKKARTYIEKLITYENNEKWKNSHK